MVQITCSNFFIDAIVLAEVACREKLRFFIFNTTITFTNLKNKKGWWENFTEDGLHFNHIDILPNSYKMILVN